jgi:poly(A) polymerase
MHDIAKPSSVTQEGERRRFIGHDLSGAKMASELLKKLKVGKKTARSSARIVGSHMRLYGLAHQREATLRSRLRFIRDIGQETPEELLLCLADESATGPGAPALVALEKTVDEIFTLFWQEEPPAPLLMGRDLIEMLGLGEGKEIGRILGAVAQAEAEGKVSSREEALEYARHILDEQQRGR